MLAVSVAVLLAFFPLQPTGYMTSATASEASASHKTGGEPQVTVTFSSYDIEQCSDELAACMQSVSELSDIVLDKCEKPHHDFEVVAWDVAKAHDYSENEFNCEDFSASLAERLGGLGYSARLVHGYYKGEPHTWVVAEIPIESTSGNIITPQQYADYTEK